MRTLNCVIIASNCINSRTVLTKEASATICYVPLYLPLRKFQVFNFAESNTSKVNTSRI